LTGEPASKESNGAPCAYRIKSKVHSVSIMLCCQLCSTHYTAVCIKKSTKNTDDDWKPSCACYRHINTFCQIWMELDISMYCCIAIHKRVIHASIQFLMYRYIMYRNILSVSTWILVKVHFLFDLKFYNVWYSTAQQFTVIYQYCCWTPLLAMPWDMIQQYSSLYMWLNFGKPIQIAH